MADLAPSRSAILELREERQAMAEGYAFLDEKCLAIAGEIVRELARYEALAVGARQASEDAAQALASALARHGLAELQAYPPPAGPGPSLGWRVRSVMGVKLADGTLVPGGSWPEQPGWGSPEAVACREAFGRLLALAPALAGAVGNLERLSEEYRRSSRRARALNDVLIPEAGTAIAALETGLEDLEREDAVAMRLGAR